ncbi:YHYH domain-containing protein [Paenibacillus lemnae]|uniref:YHYH domain-containing protein n=1 Tax=Paenibacillus lemnae TaxID=1330551 RepID=A0A848M7Z2_PAELE|nr:YHYH domain-containing protein [Paenibacillus lemnae]
MKKTLLFLLVLLLIFSSQAAEAHPGRTDSSGGHTCRTNCGKWGLSSGEYHTHNGGLSFSDDVEYPDDEGSSYVEVPEMTQEQLEETYASLIKAGRDIGYKHGVYCILRMPRIAA